MARWWQWLPLPGALAAIGVALALAEVRALVAVAATPRRQRLAVRLVVLRGLVRTGWDSGTGGGAAAGHGAGETTARGHPPRRGRDAPVVEVEPVLRYLLGPPWRVGLGRLRAHIRVGTGDPAATAVACGVLHGLAGAALGVLGAWVRAEGAAPRIEVWPDYRRPVASLRAGCILRTRLGHLIVALALGWWAARRGGALRT